MKKDFEAQAYIISNISVVKNVLTATHTKYKVSNDIQLVLLYFMRLLRDSRKG
jgi:hypothetical protein